MADRPWRRGTRRATPSSTGRTRPCLDPVSVATAPIARTIAANAPNWARFFQSWSTASAATGVGSGIGGSWSPRGRLDDLGQEPGEQRRREPDEQEQPGDDRQPQSSATTRAAPCAGGPAGRSCRAVPSRPTRRRKTSSSEGRTRSNAASRTPASTTSGSSPADGGAPVRHRHDEPPVGLGHAARPRAIAGEARRQRGDRRLLPGLRVRADRAACAYRARSSSSGPSVTSRPWSRIPTRSQIRSTSARTWVEKMTVALRAAPRSARGGRAGPPGRAS